jgi:cellulose synthase/poly-beta-1,6-N-acetylglucosamine synthase-like glycosyltransferase
VRNLEISLSIYDINVLDLKQGALNAALEYTDKNAEIVAVIDADYKVESPWLVDLVPLFDDPKVAIVQAPQDHRDGDEYYQKSYEC